MASFVDSRDQPKVQHVEQAGASPIGTALIKTPENLYDKVQRDVRYLDTYDANATGPNGTLGQKVTTVSEVQKFAEQQRKTEIDTAWKTFVTDFVNKNLSDPANAAFIRQQFPQYLSLEEDALRKVFQNTMDVIFIQRRGGPISESELQTMFLYQIGNLPVLRNLIDRNVFAMVEPTDYKRGMLNIKTFFNDFGNGTGSVLTPYTALQTWGPPNARGAKMGL